MHDELMGYVEVLTGRLDPPIENGVLSLMETANAYYARAMEMTMLIHHGELDGDIQKGSRLYRFRTGELRDFTELASKACDLGSRRLTEAMRQAEMRKG